MKQILLFIGVSLLSFFVFSGLFKTDVDVEKIDLDVNRFEKELFLVTPENIQERMITWGDTFGTFPQVFASQIMQRAELDDKQYALSLLAFTTHNDMREAYDSTALQFNDFTKTEQELELAFSYFANEFPSYPLPTITTFFSGFNYGVVTYDDNLAIGLENFLGSNSKYYELLGDPEYLRFQKQKKFIAPNVMEVWLNEYFQQYAEGRDLLSQMIYKGKVMYCIDKMLPNLPMEDKFRFTKDQMNWVEDNEVELWEYLIHEELLFSKKESKYRSYLDYAPFAKGMPADAPGRVAYFIGYKMVSEFMANNDMSIEEMMYLNNSRQFLKLSKYKPTKFLL